MHQDVPGILEEDVDVTLGHLTIRKGKSAEEEVGRSCKRL